MYRCGSAPTVSKQHGVTIDEVGNLYRTCIVIVMDGVDYVASVGARATEWPTTLHGTQQGWWERVHHCFHQQQYHASDNSLKQHDSL